MANNDYYTDTWPRCVASWYASGGVLVEAHEITELQACSEFKRCSCCGGDGCAACLWRGEYAMLRFKPVIVGYEAGRVLSEAEALQSRDVALRYVTRDDNLYEMQRASMDECLIEEDNLKICDFCGETEVTSILNGDNDELIEMIDLGDVMACRKCEEAQQEENHND